MDHVQALRSGTALAPSDDPSSLVHVHAFAEQLEQIRVSEGDAALRSLAHDYVALWARTFRTLVRHLRGRPERTLALWCEEVYPFLRGNRRASRIEQRSKTEAHVSLADDLPAPYLAGLLEAFVGLSGAESSAKAIGRQVFSVTYHLHPSDQAARAIHWMAGLRIPLLATAGLAALTAVAWSSTFIQINLWTAIAVLIGTVAAQSGANAVRDLRDHELGPLAMPKTGKSWKQFQAGGSYLLAAAALSYLAVTGDARILWFAAAGLILGVGYAAFSDQGLGPAIAAVAQGPLIVLGAAWAFDPQIVIDQWPVLVMIGTAPGMLTAALLFTGDLSDRPLDEAAGRRTMAVRMPAGRNALVLAVLAVSGVGIAAAAVASSHGPTQALWLLPSMGIALALAREVRITMNDPHGMARARVTSIGLHILTTLLLSVLILQGATP
jgi:1,4-dihydroxy-2-naphthoate octaprenyltransferase